MKKTDALLHTVREEAHRHAGIPFWSWNDRLEPPVLADQIANMQKLGMQGFFMHARGGLKVEYLSKEWFDTVRFCIREAKKRGMEAWAYDENGWPSGFAGGELLHDPHNHACGLEMESASAFPDLSADENILGVYVVKDGKVKRVEKDPGSSVLIIRRKRDFSYVDTMNPAITKKFIHLTHERYKREIGEEFGKTMPGFFTDEPQYFRYGIPWSDTFVQTFFKRFGYDVRSQLPFLFTESEGYEAFRYDYYLHCHESFCQGYMKPIFDWCDQNHIQLTGHGIEEWGLSRQMMCCGGVMPLYRYMHIPGIDYLNRSVRNISGAKQLGSVCEQTEKKMRLTESYASCGWDVTPKELKRLTEMQFAGGVNLICAHLYAYSERGQRKRDYPNHYSELNPWQSYYGVFETYFQNLGSALSQGKEWADTLVIHPIRSAYLRYFRPDKACIQDLDDRFNAFVEQFSKDHICYHFGDEGIMEDLASVEGNTLRVGACRYNKVVLPCCETLSENTVRLLREYLKNGGRLYIHGQAPIRINGREADLSDLTPNLTYEEICNESGISVTQNGESIPLHGQVRLTSAGRMIFLVNFSGRCYRNAKITIANCKGLAQITVDKLEMRPLRGKQNADGSVTVLYDFTDSASLLMVESDIPMAPFAETEAPAQIRLPAEFLFVEKPENALALDRAQVQKDGGTYSELLPIEQIRDELLQERFEGTLSLRFRFFADFQPEHLFLVAEPLANQSVKINGEEITLCPGGRIDRSFLQADIARKTIVGENTVELTFPYRQREEVYRVLYGGGHEALRNCLDFDTEIEAVYLFGDFSAVSKSEWIPYDETIYRTAGEFCLLPQKSGVDLTDPVRNGYPFFAGEMKVKTKIVYHAGDPTVLCPGGHYAVCGVSVNGTPLEITLFENGYDLSSVLREGENEIVLTLCFSNRNLLGPHHRRGGEPRSSSPVTFSFESQWKNGECPEFDPSYSFIRMGIGFEANV